MKYQRDVPKDDRDLHAMLINGDCLAMCSIERRATVSVGSIGGGDVRRI